MKNFAGLLSLLLITGVLSHPNRPTEFNEDYAVGDENYNDEDDVVDEPQKDTTPPIELPVFLPSETVFTVREGDPLALDCQIENPDNFKDYSLLFQKFGGNILIVDVKTIYPYKFFNDNGIIRLNSTRRENAGVYSCHYQITKDNVKKTFTINVQYPPKIVSNSKAERTVRKGEDVAFGCVAQGNPDPEIMWTKRKGHLPSGKKSVKGLNITFENVDRHVEGTYVCTADNGIDRADSASMKLLVEYEPEIITEKLIVNKAEGNVVQLVCIVHSRPFASVEWKKDGLPLVTDARRVKEANGGHRHTIEVQQITDIDFGVYECTAQNDQGMAKGVLTLSDTPKEPAFTSDPVSADETAYTLTWKTESFYPIVQYKLKYRPITTNISEYEEAIVDLPETDSEHEGGLVRVMMHKIEDLNSATDYEALVSVKNKEKWGKEGHFKFSTKKAAPPTPPSSITNTTSPIVEESAQSPVEETANSRTSGNDRVAANVALSMVFSLLLLLKS